MAGLFSLGGGGGRGNDAEDQQHHHQQNEIPPPPDSSLFWYSNKNHDDVVSSSYRGFEIWNQQQQHLVPAQPQPRAFFQQADLYTSAAALGVGPSEASRSGKSGGSGGGGGGASCQDCGNQAKKDCPHVRCRTCCKSRGFDCQTHLKSTWVPASKRRERQQQQQQQLVPTRQQRDHGHNVHNPTSSSLACTLLPPNPSHSGGLEEVNFPAVVSTPAEFKCVRVSSVDEADEEYAYSTAVNIGGHVFRGILYDHGPDGNSYTAAGAGSSSSTGGGVVQPLNLISAAGNTTAVGAIVDPSSLYPAPLNAFMPASGTQFFPHPRP